MTKTRRVQAESDIDCAGFLLATAGAMEDVPRLNCAASSSNECCKPLENSHFASHLVTCKPQQREMVIEHIRHAAIG